MAIIGNIPYFQANPYPMTDPWCCYILGNMDPMNIPPMLYISYMDPMGIRVTNLWDDMLGACQGSGWEILMELGWNAGCEKG